MDNRQILSEIIVQILGFGAVFFILKTFAWKKLLQVIDARRHKIDEGFQNIETQKKDLENLEQEYRQKLQHIEEEARLKIQEAAGVGLALAKDIQEKARHDSEKLLDRAKAEIEQDILKAKLSMRDQIVELSSLMTEKIIREKLDVKEHSRLIEQFMKDLERVS
jgi:F-type H+-transporting ATPase subunit b